METIPKVVFDPSPEAFALYRFNGSTHWVVCEPGDPDYVDVFRTKAKANAQRKSLADELNAEIVEGSYRPEDWPLMKVHLACSTFEESDEFWGAVEEASQAWDRLYEREPDLDRVPAISVVIHRATVTWDRALEYSPAMIQRAIIINMLKEKK
jgi:hypothetical protein